MHQELSHELIAARTQACTLAHIRTLSRARRRALPPTVCAHFTPLVLLLFILCSVSFLPFLSTFYFLTVSGPCRVVNSRRKLAVRFHNFFTTSPVGRVGREEWAAGNSLWLLLCVDSGYLSLRREMMTFRVVQCGPRPLLTPAMACKAEGEGLYTTQRS